MIAIARRQLMASNFVGMKKYNRARQMGGILGYLFGCDTLLT